MPRAKHPGSYVLVIRAARDLEICVGSLAILVFRAGFYLYVGSAQGGLQGRLARHLRREKRLHWHVDYLLRYATIEEVWCGLSSERYECLWARMLAKGPDLHPFPARFGASDCHCPTHLFYSQIRPTMSVLSHQVDQVALVRLEIPGAGEA